jgi:hypothetical protein
MKKSIIPIVLVVIVVVILILGALSMMKKSSKQVLRFRYFAKDAKTFRSVLTDSTPNVKSDVVGASFDLVTFPLYDHKSGKKVGLLQSTANLLDNRDKTTNVVQSITYVLPKGTITVEVIFVNQRHSVLIGKAMSMKVPIMSGTGIYSHRRGNVMINIHEDGSRDLAIVLH